MTTNRAPSCFSPAMAGTVPDNRYTDHLPALLKKTEIRGPPIDQGYFNLTTFKAIMNTGLLFFHVLVYRHGLRRDARTQEPIDLGGGLEALAGARLCQAGANGAGPESNARLSTGVLARQCPEWRCARRRRFKAHARKQGRTGSQRHLASCDWTLLITNVPEPWLPLAMVQASQTLRWQIEWLFQQFKSILRVQQANTGNEHRLRCELYGKLIAAVWVHRIHAVATTARWKAARQEISLDKL